MLVMFVQKRMHYSACALVLHSKDAGELEPYWPRVRLWWLQVAFFLPQLVQLLRGDDTGLIRQFLMAAANRSTFFAHVLVCTLKASPQCAGGLGNGVPRSVLLALHWYVVGHSLLKSCLRSVGGGLF